MAATSRASLMDLDNILTNFLKAYGKKRLKRFEAAGELTHLREMTFGNSKDYWRLDDRFKALEGWFLQIGPRLAKDTFDRQMIEQASQCVEKIGSYCRLESTAESSKTFWFDRNRAAKVAGMANAFLQERSRAMGFEYTPMGLKLVRPPEAVSSAEHQAGAIDDDVKSKFKESLNYQREMIEYFHRPEDHLFTVVGYLLDSLDKMPDEFANHMAASILYFMKLRGYKVEPYVQRLRQETRKSSSV
jgi:hypothetical protein